MAFKKPPTKAQLRAQLRKEMRHYLDKGGKIDRIARGVSGRDSNLPLPRVFFEVSPSQRTGVEEVIASIDSRRKPKKTMRPFRKDKSSKLKTIYDDFGEPLRKIWVDE